MLMCFIFLGCSSFVLAQHSYFTHNLWKDSERGVEGRHRSKVFIYAPYSDSETMPPKAPAVIIMPGGSYTYLAIYSEGHNVAKYFVSMGFRAVVLRYRMGFYGARYPQHLEDYRLAVDYIRENADRLGIDTSRTGVVGFSAGGHLAGCTAMEDNPYYRPACVGMIYPVVTMREPYVHRPSKRHLLRGDDSMVGKLSLEENIRDDFPPIYLLHCEDDRVVNPSASHTFVSELERKGVPCVAEFHPTGGHGFGLKPSSRSAATGWADRFVAWLNSTVLK